jgi:hypothetical protein
MEESAAVACFDYGRGWCGFSEEAAWCSTEWRAGLLRITDEGRDKVAGGNWGVACCA